MSLVAKEKVLQTARKENAISFDAPGAKLTHYNEGGKEFVSFDSIVKKYNLKDPALLELAKIVRGADAHLPDSPESAGLESAASGFRELTMSDFENMELQFPLHDVLYKYCQLKLQESDKVEHATH
jgi:hypothetical protein